MAKLLIADSSPKAYEKLKFFLEQDSHEVKFLQETDSMEIVLAETKFDAIIVDIQYKYRPSLDLINMIHNDKINSYTEIIATTGVANRDILNQFISAGVSYLFIKPYRYKLLSEKLKKIVEPNQNAHGAFEPLILKIFLESTIYIFEHMTGSSVVSGKPFLKSGNKSLAEVSAVIGLSSSQVKGSMSINLDRSILARFLFKLFGNTVVPDEGQLTDICGEICNQIVGRAKQQFLKKKNMGFEISVPTVLSESNHILDYKSASPVLVIPFIFEKNEGIFVEFCLELNDKQAQEQNEQQVVVEEGEFILF
ncbi:MAG: chemotaxis protein CheX [Bdellovibrionota bacterium]